MKLAIRVGDGFGILSGLQIGAKLECTPTQMEPEAYPPGYGNHECNAKRVMKRNKKLATSDD